MLALCPKCGASIKQVHMAEVEAKSDHGPSLRGVTYSCLHCFHVLSVGLDPMAIKSDMVKQIVDEIKKLQQK